MGQNLGGELEIKMLDQEDQPSKSLFADCKIATIFQNDKRYSMSLLFE